MASADCNAMCCLERPGHWHGELSIKSTHCMTSRPHYTWLKVLKAFRISTVSTISWYQEMPRQREVTSKENPKHPRACRHMRTPTRAHTNKKRRAAIQKRRLGKGQKRKTGGGMVVEAPDEPLLGHGLVGVERHPAPALVLHQGVAQGQAALRRQLHHQSPFQAQPLYSQMLSLNNQGRVAAQCEAGRIYLLLHAAPLLPISGHASLDVDCIIRCSYPCTCLQGPPHQQPACIRTC